MDFFELLKFSIGSIDHVSEEGDTDWEKLQEISKKQALTGVVYAGVERLPEHLRPLKRQLLKWYYKADKVKLRNKEEYEACGILSEMFHEAGIECCVLKGQGNALMYPDPYTRVSGDIDLWVNPQKVQITDGKLIVGNRQLKVGRQVYHHFDVESVHGVSVEIHTRPSFMNNLMNNRRMQRWFSAQADEQFSNKVTLPVNGDSISVPTAEFNVVYQLSHISKHFFQEGIGLRQFVDYYYVLRQAQVDRNSMAATLKSLGLYKMAKTVMYVEHELLGLDAKYLIVPIDQKRGRFMYDEIMASGNFGHYDRRVGRFFKKTAVGRNLERIRRDFRLMWFFPSECLWEPVFRVWHFAWRLKNSH